MRGPLRDALTVFDEKRGPAVKRLLRCGRPCARDWQRLFIELRPLRPEARNESCSATPRWKAGFTTKTDGSARLSSAASYKIHSCFDGWLAQAMQPQPWDTEAFRTLPVLGCQAGGRATKRRSFTQTPRCFARPGEQTCTRAHPGQAA